MADPEEEETVHCNKLKGNCGQIKFINFYSNMGTVISVHGCLGKFKCCNSD